MHAFTDNQGRAWTVAISIATVRRVKALCGGFDLQTLDGDKLRPLGALLADPVQLCNVVYAILKPDLDAKGVSDEQFGEALAGDAIQAMTDAFVRALIDFFPNQKGRVALLTATKKAKEVTNLALDAMTQRLEKIDAGAEVQKLMGSSDGSPASAESTPAPSASAT